MAQRELLLQEALGDEVAAGIVDVFQRQATAVWAKPPVVRLSLMALTHLPLTSFTRYASSAVADPLKPLRNVLMRSS